MVWDGCIKWRGVFGNSSTILKGLECLETMCSKEWHEQSEMGAFNCFDPFLLPALLHEKENTGQLSIQKKPYESLTCMISKTFPKSQPLLAHLPSEPINLTQYRHKWNSFKLCMLRQRRTDPRVDVMIHLHQDHQARPKAMQASCQDWSELAWISQVFLLEDVLFRNLERSLI